ncbi:hypothetical protein [Marinobacter sp. ANT_B65]|uniref:hypothetical protein n=1 Tax=Marinobacter sp. ANT_B65 TaxID=2039467 RepID=UPI000BBE2097|nr:hypothetical protein [Marinobacter sp. ANT_B65]PCM43423.1 hypothetical protein CPA50_13630 [Marinobacter sp. ANT_B65]
MSLDKDFRVSIYKNEALLCTYELHTEFEDDEYVDVSSRHTSGEPFDDPLEDEAIDLILESGLDSGVGIVQGFKIEWVLLNMVFDD